jgi:hypothetical protein
MTENRNHDVNVGGDGLDPGAVRHMAERVLAETTAMPPAAEVPGKAEVNAARTEQLKKDLADPSTTWHAYSSPPIGLVSPDTIRSTRRAEAPTDQTDKYHRMNKVGGPDGEPLGMPAAQLNKEGVVVKPGTPAIREGLAAGEGIVLHFDRSYINKSPVTIAYFVDEKARRAELVSFRDDGTTRTLAITDPALAPKGFTVGERGQFDPKVNERLSGYTLASVELPSTMVDRLGVIDADGVPTVLPEEGRVSYTREVDPTLQARAALQAHAELAALPTAPPR